MRMKLDPNTIRFVKGGTREVPVMEPPRIRDEYLEEFFDSEAGSESVLYGAFRYGNRTVSAAVPDYYVYERVCYVDRPVDPKRQVMSIFIPAPYVDDPAGGRVGNHSAQTAPVLLIAPGGGFRMHGIMNAEGDELGRTALEMGFIVASPDIRGCEDHYVDTDGDGEPEYTGTAPNLLVDLKAAVRFLRDNADVLPGDYRKIVSTGGSSGGAMAELLAASGNTRRFDAYFERLGAADQPDDIQAVIPFCGPADLEHGDMAYDWFFGRYIYEVDFSTHRTPWGIEETTPNLRTGADGRPVLKINYAAGETAYDHYSDYARLFVDDYLKNVLRMTEKEYVGLCMQYLLPACHAYVKSHPGRREEQFYYFDSYADFRLQYGVEDPYYDPDVYPDCGYIHFDLFRAFNAKAAFKPSPAFDQLRRDAMPKYENALFGTEKTGFSNFTEYGAIHSDLGLGSLPMDVATRVRDQNPLSYIGDGESVCCRHWLIPHGSADGDIALCQTIDLVHFLKKYGIRDVTFDIIWNGGHSCGMVTPSRKSMLEWAEKAFATDEASSTG